MTRRTLRTGSQASVAVMLSTVRLVVGTMSTTMRPGCELTTVASPRKSMVPVPS
ncbi:MAG: hypothetical protein ACYTF3_09005 [Planctomycetota bacterium]|jgi:hypothetical protein